jgi:signal transduction histidine kinase
MKPEDPPPLANPTVKREVIAGRPSGPARLVFDDAARAIARSRELERRVQEVANRLQTPEENAVAIVEAALEALDASVGVAVRRTSDGTALELVGAAHLPDDVREEFNRFPLDAPMPVAHVVRTGRPCYCESRGALVAQFPAMRELAERLDLNAIAALPVRHMNEDHGAVAFGFAQPRTFAPGEKAALRALGARYARALRDSRRYFAEHDARMAEMAARRTAEEARTVAELSARAQGDYIAVVSHELRTPLQAILGYAELLSNGVAGEMTAQQREFAERIGAGSLSLLQIVENLLGFSAAQIGRQRVHVEAFDLYHVAEDVIELARPLAARKRLDLRAELSSITMRSDARKVQQILTNLVGNAIKFTEQGDVVLSASVAAAHSPGATTPAHVRITVRDTGPGIVASELSHLFEPFWQGPRAGSSTGTGLGLSIVRDLARLLGGDVWVDSAPRAGSTFTVDLPLVAPTDDVPVAD